MIERLKKINNGEIQITDDDKRLITLELREYERYINLGVEGGVNPGHDIWNDAHSATFEDYSLKYFIIRLYESRDYQLYHLSVIN